MPHLVEQPQQILALTLLGVNTYRGHAHAIVVLIGSIVDGSDSLLDPGQQVLLLRISRVLPSRTGLSRDEINQLAFPHRVCLTIVLSSGLEMPHPE